MKYILITIYIALTTGGLFCMKSGGDSLSIALKNGFTLKMGYVTALGFLLYICSFLLWQKLLATYDLSYIVPITTGIVQVIILMFSYFIFKENISAINFVGIILVIIGVVLISIKK
jgi:drug/metabolite transporter (DMT)-like permease